MPRTDSGHFARDGRALIGRPGQPLRALAFGGVAFETAMHLGVVHALLVTHGRAPDVVVGLSAGAVNAVTLAEILQAGDGLEPPPADAPPEAHVAYHRARMEARVGRFRQFFDAYQRVPGELLRAMVPDAFQVEAKTPLEATRLPIHASQERRDRDRELDAQAGLINLINELLQVRLSVATFARLVRRWLGIRAAREIPDRARRWLISAFESTQLWELIGANLFRLAPLAAVAIPPLFIERGPLERGASAGEIIARSRRLQALKRWGKAVWWSIVLGLTWLTLTVMVLSLPVFLYEGMRDLLQHPGFLPRLSGVEGGLKMYGGVIALIFAVWLPAKAVLPLMRARERGDALVRVLEQALAHLVSFLITVSVLLVLVRLALALPFLVAHRPATLTGVPAWLLAGWRHSGPLSLVVFGLVLVITVGVGTYVLVRRRHRGYLRRALARFDLASSLFDPNPLRQLFVSLFDPAYYGPTDLDQVLDRALSQKADVPPRASAPRTLAHYEDAARRPGIMLAIAAASVKSGNLQVLTGEHVPVVDGLLAATAVTPLFPANERVKPPESERSPLYIDATTVANEPMRALFGLLRNRVHPEASVVHAYSVSSLPFSRGRVGNAPRRFLTLMDITRRALELQRFRDATLERRLTHLYTKAIPPGRAVFRAGGKAFVRIWVTPIEPTAPLNVTDRLVEAEDLQARRDVIAETVADGCRAALEVMVRPSLARGSDDPEAKIRVLCHEAVREHFRRRAEFLPPGMAGDDPGLIGLPGNSGALSADGPGLPEVCRHCAMHRGTPEQMDRVIRVRYWDDMGPAWPHELAVEQPASPGEIAADHHFEYRPRVQRARDLLAQQREILGWPARGGQRPMVSLLFSGGVFRGVYQVGVLNAINDAGFPVDVIAGASVGSITGAMVARVLSEPDERRRQLMIARITATYLSIDRLILTDRFADFIRGFTLRAASTSLSLYEADRVLRRFDVAGGRAFNRETRRFIAGVERLFYINPFELRDMVKAVRDHDNAAFGRLLRAHVQELLDRMGVGTEVLGTELLQFIIREHILKGLACATGDPRMAPLQSFLDPACTRQSIYFLATTTNLSEGCLEILGEAPPASGRPGALLLQGLLASSAFPGVFRPRWGWELRPASSAETQYIDGGVIDNLPVDAIAQFLYAASNAGLIAARPVRDVQPVPHLLIAASLEVDPPRLRDDEVQDLADNWPALRTRARQLGYNKKLDIYEQAQRELRQLWLARPGDAKPLSRDQLDLEVVTVRPRWLCGTFAFHPMLGFRRERQAASIAHGCASTLLRLGRAAEEMPTRLWTKAWGIDASRLPKWEPAMAEPGGPDPFMPREPAGADAKPAGERCWFRPGMTCPFSADHLERLNQSRPDAEPELSPAIIRAVSAVHRLCRQHAAAHARR